MMPMATSRMSDPSMAGSLAGKAGGVPAGRLDYPPATTGVNDVGWPRRDAFASAAESVGDARKGRRMREIPPPLHAFPAAPQRMGVKRMVKLTTLPNTGTAFGLITGVFHDRMARARRIGPLVVVLAVRPLLLVRNPPAGLKSR